MQDWKKLAKQFGLLLIVVAAVVFAVKRIGGKDAPPTWVLNEPMELIDRETLEIIVLPVGQWRDLGRKTVGVDERHKHPKTGKYSMVPIIYCDACKEKIPIVEYPESVMQGTASPAAMVEVERKYICPRCGKHACQGLMGR